MEERKSKVLLAFENALSTGIRCRGHCDFRKLKKSLLSISGKVQGFELASLSQSASVAGKIHSAMMFRSESSFHRNIIPASDAVRQYVFRTGGIDYNVRFIRNMRPAFDRTGGHEAILSTNLSTTYRRLLDC